MSWKPGKLREKSDRVSATQLTRCQAIAVRCWETPITSLCRDTVPAEERPHRDLPTRPEGLAQPGRSWLAVRNLLNDSKVHVVHQEGQATRVTDVPERAGGFQAVGAFHAALAAFSGESIDPTLADPAQLPSTASGLAEPAALGRAPAPRVPTRSESGMARPAAAR
jgi:hypothetical protein